MPSSELQSAPLFAVNVRETKRKVEGAEDEEAKVSRLEVMRSRLSPMRGSQSVPLSPAAASSSLYVQGQSPASLSAVPPLPDL